MTSVLKRDILLSHEETGLKSIKLIILPAVLFLLFSAVTGPGQPSALFLLPGDTILEHEFFQARRILELHGIRTASASSEMKPLNGSVKEVTRPDISLMSVTPGQFDALIIMGGPDAFLFWTNKEVLSLIKKYHAEGAVIAAQAMGTETLASAGILYHKRCTGPSALQNDLIRAGGYYVPSGVVVDGHILTCRSDKDTKSMMTNIISCLKIPLLR